MTAHDAPKARPDLILAFLVGVADEALFEDHGPMNWVSGADGRRGVLSPRGVGTEREQQGGGREKL